MIKYFDKHNFFIHDIYYKIGYYIHSNLVEVMCSNNNLNSER